MSSRSSEPTSSVEVGVDADRDVGRISLDRPDAMNTFNTALAEELDGALGRLDAVRAEWGVQPYEFNSASIRSCTSSDS